MIAFDLIPRAAIGPFKLGASQSETRTAAAHVGFALEAEHDRSDYFASEIAIQVEYDDLGCVEFIGAHCVPALYRLRFKGIDLFDTEAESVFETFRKLEGHTAPKFDVHGVTFPKLIVTLWAADSQYDRLRINTRLPLRQVWAQIGIGTGDYRAAVQRLNVC